MISFSHKSVKKVFIGLLIPCPSPNEQFSHIFVHSSDINQPKQILVYLSIQGSQAALWILNFIVPFPGQFRGPLG